MLIYTCLNFLPLFPNLQWKIWWHYKYLSLYALLHYHKARSELENSFQRNSSLRWSILWKCEYKASTKTETKFSSCNESGKPERALKVYGLRYAEEVKSNMRILLLPSTGIRSYNPMWNWNVTNLSLSLLKGSVPNPFLLCSANQEILQPKFDLHLTKCKRSSALDSVSDYIFCNTSFFCHSYSDYSLMPINYLELHMVLLNFQGFLFDIPHCISSCQMPIDSTKKKKMSNVHWIDFEEKSRIDDH